VSPALAFRTWFAVAGVPLSIFGLPLLHPESTLAKAWSFFMILVRWSPD
jgi:hypothetical protein